MKISLLGLLIFAFISCNNKSAKPSDDRKGTSSYLSDTTITDVNIPVKDPVTDTLMKLPFVINSNHYIDSISNHQHGISFIADTADNEILVKAGYNGTERFETYYHFSIDRKTSEIKILEPVTGDYISLEEYQKNNQK